MLTAVVATLVAAVVVAGSVDSTGATSVRSVAGADVSASLPHAPSIPLSTIAMITIR